MKLKLNIQTSSVKDALRKVTKLCDWNSYVQNFISKIYFMLHYFLHPLPTKSKVLPRTGWFISFNRRHWTCLKLASAKTTAIRKQIVRHAKPAANMGISFKPPQCSRLTQPCCQLPESKAGLAGSAARAATWGPQRREGSVKWRKTHCMAGKEL